MQLSSRRLWNCVIPVFVILAIFLSFCHSSERLENLKLEVPTLKVQVPLGSMTSPNKNFRVDLRVAHKITVDFFSTFSLKILPKDKKMIINQTWSLCTNFDCFVSYKYDAIVRKTSKKNPEVEILNLEQETVETFVKIAAIQWHVEIKSESEIKFCLSVIATATSDTTGNYFVSIEHRDNVHHTKPVKLESNTYTLQVYRQHSNCEMRFYAEDTEKESKRLDIRSQLVAKEGDIIAVTCGSDNLGIPRGLVVMTLGKVQLPMMRILSGRHPIENVKNEFSQTEIYTTSVIVRKWHNGQDFECKVNQKGIIFSSKRKKLIVYHRPYAIKVHPSSEVEVYSVIVCSCKSNPPPNIKWRRVGLELPGIQIENYRLLVTENADLTKKYTFQCICRNKLGTIKKTVNFKATNSNIIRYVYASMLSPVIYVIITSVVIFILWKIKVPRG